jgi:hypothetical protein
MIDDAASPSNLDANDVQLSAGAITAWDARPGVGEPWLWKKEEILDRFEQGLKLAPLHSNVYRKAA